MLTYKILGPLEVVRDGEALPLGPAKQRALLVCLLLHADETVSRDRLIDDLWGENPPARADQNLFQHVFRLRKILDDGGREVLVRKDQGYLIRLGQSDEVDARRFEALLERARDEIESDAAGALATLDQAVALWRGPALTDFTFENFAQTEAARLEELRVGAEEARIEALLDLRRHKDTIPKLRALVQAHPTREHLYALMSLALYRAGRQAEALAAIQSARKALAAEYGIDPGPELRQLEEAILRQDSELDLPESPPVEAIPPRAATQVPSSTARRGHRRSPSHGRFLAPAAVVILATMLVVGALILLPDEPPRKGGNQPEASPSTPPVAGLRLDWNEAPRKYFDAEGQQRVLGGVETKSGFGAYGFTLGPTDYSPHDYDVAVWLKTTGHRWQASTSLDFVGPGNQRATKAWSFDDGSIVLLGWDGSGNDFDAAIWVLPTDKTVWHRVLREDEALGGPGDQYIRDATLSSPSTIIAVGYTFDGTDEEASVWEGAKAGRSWTHLEGAISAETGDQEMATIAHSTQSHRIVIAGYSEVDGNRDAAVWTRRNHQWKRVDGQAELEGPYDQQINEVIPYRGTFIAVGEETVGSDTDAVVWRSDDGRDWRRVGDSDVFGGPGDQRMYAIARSDRGFVAAGSDVTDDSDGAVWTSLDGDTWERLPPNHPSMTPLADIGFQEVAELLPIDGGFLAFGSEGLSETDRDARVWMGTPIA